MQHDWKDRALALAGLFLASETVVNLAHSGKPDPSAQETLLNSLFVTDPDSTEAVYPERFARLEAVRLLQRRLSGQHLGPEALEATRHAVALLHLARKLLQDSVRMAHLAREIATTRPLVEQYGIDHEIVQNRLAALYQATISTLAPRILVQGDPAILSTPYRQAQIRALLLAGVRAAVLFHQVGGRRWQILFRRRRLLEAANQLLREA